MFSNEQKNDFKGPDLPKSLAWSLHSSWFFRNDILHKTLKILEQVIWEKAVLSTSSSKINETLWKNHEVEGRFDPDDRVDREFSTIRYTG